jgi:hypothetical protein
MYWVARCDTGRLEVADVFMYDVLGRAFLFCLERRARWVDFYVYLVPVLLYDMMDGLGFSRRRQKQRKCRSPKHVEGLLVKNQEARRFFI